MSFLLSTSSTLLNYVEQDAGQTVNHSVILMHTWKQWTQWAREWRFQPGITPLSHWSYQVIAVALYFIMIHALQRTMATRKPLDIPQFLFLHNAMLCAASLVLALWLSSTLIARYRGGLTLHQLVCSRDIFEDGHLHLIYYINMFFKVWEFMDTFLLALRKKPIAFLHAYHHAATLVLTWSQLVEHSGCQWVPIVINLWVHVFMYYYYAMSALRIRIWWKKYLTTLQIMQFIIDVVVVNYAYGIFIMSGFDETVCYGTTRGAVVGIVVLTSYLFLFIQFYVRTYLTSARKPSSSRAQQRTTTTTTEERKKQ